MGTKFLVLGLQDRQVITDVSLGRNGISEEHKYFVVGINEGYFDTYPEALKRAEEIGVKYEDGVEIKPVLYKS